MKKLIIFALSIFLIIIIFYSCAKKRENQITLLMWGRAEEIKAVDGFIKKFNEIYPNIYVKRLHVNVNEYSDKLQTMMAAGTPPDVMYMGSEYFPSYASKDVLLDLTPYFKNDPDTKNKKFNKNDYFKEVMKPFQYKGKYYGIPKDFTTMVLYYNKDIFDKEGIKYPDKTWTWDDLKKAAIALTRKQPNGTFEHFGFLFESWIGYWISWVWQNDSKVFDEKNQRYILGEEPYLSKNVEALQFLYDLMYKYHACPTIQETRDMGQSELFETGKIAMCTYGRWRVLELKNVQSFKWDTAILPKNKNQASTLFTVCYSISKNSKNKLNAWRLVKFLVGETGQISTAESCLAVPSLKSIAYSDHFFKPKVLSSRINAKAYLEQIPYSKPTPAHPKAQELNAVISRHLDDIFVNHKPIKDTLIALQKELDEMEE